MDPEVTQIIQRGLNAWYWHGFIDGCTACGILYGLYLLAQFAIGFRNGWKRSAARRS